MGEAQTPHFYDFGIFEPVAKPENQLFLSSETPGHLKLIKRNPLDISILFFINVKLWKPICLTFFEKTGTGK